MALYLTFTDIEIDADRHEAARQYSDYIDTIKYDVRNSEHEAYMRDCIVRSFLPINRYNFD